jgi:hypothetical protein
MRIVFPIRRVGIGIGLHVSTLYHGSGSLARQFSCTRGTNRFCFGTVSGGVNRTGLCRSYVRSCAVSALSSFNRYSRASGGRWRSESWGRIRQSV